MSQISPLTYLTRFLEFLYRLHYLQPCSDEQETGSDQLGRRLRRFANYEWAEVTFTTAGLCSPFLSIIAILHADTIYDAKIP